MNKRCEFTDSKGQRCTRLTEVDRLFCFPHWRDVPQPLQWAVWRAWKDRLAGKGEAAHEAAKQAATRVLRRKLGV